MAQAHVMETPYSACHCKPLGGIMCGLYWAIHSQDKDGADIDFMYLTMIDAAPAWFEIVELLVTTDADISMDTTGQRCSKTHRNTKLPYCDKSSAMIGNLPYNLEYKTPQMSKDTNVRDSINSVKLV